MHISSTLLRHAGTEDGLLARCSTSYTEQYLEVIQAHAGPVNRCRISPFLPTMLLTCSADWTVKLWAITPGSSAGGTSNPPSVTFSVDDVKDAVTDIAWSPVVSTIFSAVTRDGHVQVRTADVPLPSSGKERASRLPACLSACLPTIPVVCARKP
ncbi:WD40 repeat domain-containing protein [archaeon]|nr:MAG: WD40 repeat domain-containing protein [archaeon]